MNIRDDSDVKKIFECFGDAICSAFIVGDLYHNDKKTVRVYSCHDTEEVSLNNFNFIFLGNVCKQELIDNKFLKSQYELSHSSPFAKIYNLGDNKIYYIRSFDLYKSEKL